MDLLKKRVLFLEELRLCFEVVSERLNLDPEGVLSSKWPEFWSKEVEYRLGLMFLTSLFSWKLEYRVSLALSSSVFTAFCTGSYLIGGKAGFLTSWLASACLRSALSKLGTCCL